MMRTALFLSLMIVCLPALAIDSSLSYQGTLEDAGQPANGSYGCESQSGEQAAQVPIGSKLIVGQDGPLGST